MNNLILAVVCILKDTQPVVCNVRPRGCAWGGWGGGGGGWGGDKKASYSGGLNIRGRFSTIV